MKSGKKQHDQSFQVFERAQVNIVHLTDCMDFMTNKPDKYYDLAIVDPPYGVGDFQQSDGNYKPVKWNDKTPNSVYFAELKRIAKNQIIWGANFYN